MNIKKLSNVRDEELIIKLWNDEYGKIFPLKQGIFKHNIENCYKEASFVAYEKDELVGFIIGKIWQEKFELAAYKNVGWVSLIYVKPAYRKQGIGTSLLSKTEEALKNAGKEVMNLGRDCMNFFPGLPVDFEHYLKWFEKRGFSSSGLTHDLIKQNDGIALPIKNANNNFTFRIGNINDKDAIINFLNRVWPGRWTWEAQSYFEHGGTGKEYLLVLNENNEVCGFTKICYPETKDDCISYSMTYRARFKALGGIGPLGIDPAYRGKGLGYDVVASAVNELTKIGVSDMIIDWTGLMEFYRLMGFEVWKSYFYVSKRLS